MHFSAKLKPPKINIGKLQRHHHYNHHHHHHQYSNQNNKKIQCTLFVAKKQQCRDLRVFGAKFWSWKWCWCQKMTNIRCAHYPYMVTVLKPSAPFYLPASFGPHSQVNIFCRKTLPPLRQNQKWTSRTILYLARPYPGSLSPCFWQLWDFERK